MKKLLIGLLVLSLLVLTSCGPKSIDVDCMVELFEEGNLTEVSNKYGKGVINEEWTLNEIYDKYWMKHPYSKFALAAFFNHYLVKCEK